MREGFGPVLPAWGEDHPRGGGRRTVRDWIVDIVFFLVLLAVVALVVFAALVQNPPEPRVWVLVDMMAGTLAVAALWLRRRWPVGVALALLPLVAVSQAAGLPSIVACFSVVERRRLPVALAVSASGVAASLLGHLVRPSTLPFWTFVVLGVLLGATLTTCGQFLRARRLLVRSLYEQVTRAQDEQQLRVRQARRAERRQIAREMHDVLAHRMSLLSMHAGALAFRQDAPPGELARAAEVIRGSAHQALIDLRQVIGLLRDEDDEAGPARPVPTLADIPALIAEARTAGDHIEIDRDVGLRSLPTEALPSVGRDIYRVLQEALTNARKHAPGESVRVRLIIDGEAILVEVGNRISAITGSIPGSGVGLIGLSERIRLAGGELGHGPVGEDYVLWARLPFRA